MTFNCDKCLYTTNSKSHLTRHIKQVHDKIKNHKCDKCGFSTSTNSDLKSIKNVCMIK